MCVCVCVCRGIGCKVIERQGGGEAVVDRAFKSLGSKREEIQVLFQINQMFKNQL